jgi:hypothetical protein
VLAQHAVVVVLVAEAGRVLEEALYGHGGLRVAVDTGAPRRAGDAGRHGRPADSTILPPRTKPPASLSKPDADADADADASVDPEGTRR